MNGMGAKAALGGGWAGQPAGTNQKLTEVKSVMANLSDSISVLDELIHQTDVKFSSALRGISLGNADVSKAERAYSSELAVALNSFDIRIRAIIELVNQINDRCEL